MKNGAGVEFPFGSPLNDLADTQICEHRQTQIRLRDNLRFSVFIEDETDREDADDKEKQDKDKFPWSPLSDDHAALLFVHGGTRGCQIS